MSTHKVEVIRIKEILPHPNADLMELVQIGNYTCCVGKGQFKAGDLAIYIQPDYVVPADDARYDFLKGHLRIKAKKLRGVWSQGLLTSAESDMQEGDNVMERLRIVRYEPDAGIQTRGDTEKAPAVIAQKYDIESWYNFSEVFTEGEEIVATEKIHGCNARFVWADSVAEGEPKMRMFCGSRTMWIKPFPSWDANGHNVGFVENVYWAALKQNPWIEEFCRANPYVVLYGEIFGWVQKLRYGAKQHQYFFRAFDLLDKGMWVDQQRIDTEKMCWMYDAESDLIYPQIGKLQWVPELYRGPYDKKLLLELAEGKTTIAGADHIREGIVIKPVRERYDHRCGRVIAKIVSNAYLEKEY